MQGSTATLDLAQLPALTQSLTRADSTTFLSRVTRFFYGAPFAYLTLIVLQLGAIRGITTARDITYGDTSVYYLMAMNWPQSLQINIAWSPLYAVLFGSMIGLTDDPIVAVLWHRLMIIFIASLLVLTVMRRMLPPGWAWLMAAWWCVLPINFNTLYEVHLFAVVPLLVTWLLLARNTSWTRGAALAVLSASVVLVRNEMIIASGLLAVAFAIYETLVIRRGQHTWPTQLRPLLSAYGIPLLVAVGVCALFYSRSYYKGPALDRELSYKHTLNMAQVYSFGYQQRHPEWTLSPWTQHQELMTETFGQPLPTLREMIAANPTAVREHFIWNLGLTGNGLQLLLFNGTSGKINPDYIPMRLGERWTRIPTVLMAVSWLTGLTLLVRHRRFWWCAWLKQRAFVWAGMFAVAAVAPVVICTQRPRPSYFFGLSVVLMTMTGMFLFVMAHHSRLPRKLLRLVPIWMLVIVAAVWLSPKIFPWAGLAPHEIQRHLTTRIVRLKPFEALYRDTDTTIVQGEYAGEVQAYVGLGKCTSHDYSELRQNWPKGLPLEEYLAARDVNAIYFDEAFMAWLLHERAADARAFLAPQPPQGWQLLGSGDTPHDRWRLFQRPAEEPLPIVQLPTMLR